MCLQCLCLNTFHDLRWSKKLSSGLRLKDKPTVEVISSHEITTQRFWKVTRNIPKNIPLTSHKNHLDNPWKANFSEKKKILKLLAIRPFWMRFIKWVVKPAILLRRRLEGMVATSSVIFLLTLRNRTRIYRIYKGVFPLEMEKKTKGPWNEC